MVGPRPLSAGRRHRAGVRRGRLVNLTGTTGALLDAYNRHDVETVASLYTADGTHEDMAPNKRKVGAAAIAAGLSTFFGWFQIGSASCRESVCQYVSISVVA